MVREGEVAQGSDPTRLMHQELCGVEKIIQPNFRIIRALTREHEDLLGFNTKFVINDLRDPGQVNVPLWASISTLG